MSMRIRVGLGCGLATCLAAIAASASTAFPASAPGDNGSGRQSIESSDYRLVEPTGRTGVRIVGPKDGQQVGTILYGVLHQEGESVDQWGGPR